MKKNSFKIFLVLFIGIVVLFFSQKGNEEKDISNVDGLLRVEKTLEEIASIPYTPEEEMKLCNDRIIKNDGNKLTAFDLQGFEKWEYELSLDEEVFLVNNSIYIQDKSTSDVKVLNSEGKRDGTIRLDSKIFSVTEKDSALVLLSKGEDSESVNFLSKEGEILNSISVEGLRIFSATVNKNKSKYAVSTFEIDGEKILSNLSIYGKEGSKIEEVYAGDEIILYLDFISDDKLIVLTEEKVLCIEKDKVTWEKDFVSKPFVYLDKENDDIYLLSGKSVEIFSSVGEIKKEIRLSEDYKRIVSLQDDKVLYGDEYIMILNKGREVLKYKSDEMIKKVDVKEPYVVVFTSDKAKIMNIKTKI